MVGKAAEHVVEDALAHCTARHRHAVDLELGERRIHDREPARQHRQPVGAQSLEFDPVDVAGLDHLLPQLVQRIGSDGAVAEAVQLADFRERTRGAA